MKDSCCCEDNSALKGIAHELPILIEPVLHPHLCMPFVLINIESNDLSDDSYTFYQVYHSLRINYYIYTYIYKSFLSTSLYKIYRCVILALAWVSEYVN